MFYLCESNTGTLTLFVEDDRDNVIYCHTYNGHKNPEHDCAIDLVNCAICEFDENTDGNEIDTFLDWADDFGENAEDYAGKIIFSSAWRESHNGLWYGFDAMGVAGSKVRSYLTKLIVS